MHAVEDGCVVSVRTRGTVHFLNATAMFVLEQCTGEVAWDDVQPAFERIWEVTLPFDVRTEILAEFEAVGIIVPADRSVA